MAGTTTTHFLDPPDRVSHQFRRRAEAVLRIVEGDALNEARRHFLR